MKHNPVFSLITLALFCLSFSTHAPAATPSIPPGDGQDVKLLSQIGGMAYAVAIQGDYAYLCLGFKLVVLDISQPAATRFLGEVLLHTKAEDVTVSGSFAYVASDASLFVIDISDPAAALVTGSITLESKILDLVVFDGYAYLSDRGTWQNGEHSGGGLHVVDVRTPTTPRAVGFYDTLGFLGRLSVEGSILYLAENSSYEWNSGQGGLRIFDLKNPAAPVQIGYFPDPQNPLELAVSGGLVYLLNDSHNITIASKLWIIDARQPSAPAVLSRIDIPGVAMTFGDLVLAGDWVYIAEAGGIFDVTNTLRIVNVQDPRRPQAQPDFELPSDQRPGGLAVAGGRLYVCAHQGGLRVMDLSSPATPAEVGFYLEPPVVSKAAISGGAAYLVHSQALYVVDVSQLDRPRMVGHLPSKYGIADLAAAGTTVYLAGEGLQVIDVADPYHPKQIAFIPPEKIWFSDIALDGRYAYVAVGNYTESGGGLRIFDISDPARPTQVGSLDLLGSALDVVVAGDYAYVTSGQGLLVIHIFDPRAPVVVNNLQQTWGFDLEAAGGYLFVAGGTYTGVIVLDLKTPEAPVEVSRFGVGGHGTDISIAGRYLYVANNTSYTIDVWDLGDLAHPTTVAYYFPPVDLSIPGDISAITVADGNAYVSVGTAGLYILRYASPAAGQVKDFHGKPAPGVKVAIDTGATALTDPNGDYQFPRLPWDGYTLEPELSGYAFWPPQREILLPGPARGLNFTLLPAPVSVILEPGAAASLSYTDTQGLLTRLDLPAGTVPIAATLTITPTLASFRNGFQFTGHAFSLGASPNFVPAAPMAISIQYSNLDIWSVIDENALTLGRWTGSGWEDAALSCELASTYSRDPAGNRLSVPICRFGLYALFGSTRQLFMPLAISP